MWISNHNLCLGTFCIHHKLNSWPFHVTKTESVPATIFSLTAELTQGAPQLALFI